MFLSPLSRLSSGMYSLRSSRSNPLFSFESLTRGALVLSLLALTPIGLSPQERSGSESGPYEVVSMRSDRGETFKHPSGDYHTRLFTEPIHYKSGKRWQRIDNTLVPSDRSGYDYRNQANFFSVHFKDSLGDGYMRFEPAQKKAAVEVSLEQADDVDGAQPSPTSITYRAAADGADVRYDVASDGVKETVVLRDAGAPASYVFKIEPDEGQNLRAKKQPGGSIFFFAERSAKPAFAVMARDLARRSVMFIRLTAPTAT